jgi:Pentapeptide repeats (8 copies)
LVWAAVRQARTATNRHYEQTRADQQRRLTESFSKAVEQLAHDKIEARLGGIYTLERLAIEAIAQEVRSLPWWRRLRRKRPPPADPVSDLYWTVMETLTAFVRERARWQTPKAGMADKSDYLWPSETRSVTQPDKARPRPEPATDIAAVITVIQRRRGHEYEQKRGWRLDLRAVDLRGASALNGAHLEGAYLSGAHLEGASLEEAHLERADLVEAHLENAILYEAHLEGANLSNATGVRVAHLGIPFASGDARTLLPHDVPRPSAWPPYEDEEATEALRQAGAARRARSVLARLMATWKRAAIP